MKIHINDLELFIQSIIEEQEIDAIRNAHGKPVPSLTKPFRVERIVGLRRKNYICENPIHKMPVVWKSYPPYKIRTYQCNGDWIQEPRIIPRAKPICLDCRTNEYVSIIKK